MRKKAGYVLLILLTALLVCTLSVSAAPEGKKNQWVKTKSGVCWYNAKGKKVKNKFLVIKGKRYYVDKKGNRQERKFFKVGKNVYYANKKGEIQKGWKTLNKKKFYFDQKGRACPGLKKINGKTYYFSWRGEVRKGWQIVDGKKRYFHSKTGVMLKNRVIDGIRLDEEGNVVLTKKEKLLELCKQILSEITETSMTRNQKIQACYQYMASRGSFYYATWRNFGWYEDWHVDYAYEMLTGRGGNCYNFACAFAYLCKAAGCDVQIVRGRIHGSRDGAADGFTRHCWTIIDGLHYDVELAYTNDAQIYGAGSYPLSHQIQGTETI